MSHRIGPAFLQLGPRVGAKVDPWFAWLTIAVLSCPLVVSAGTVSYQYDILKRLTQVTFPGATTVHYTYDRAGNQTARLVTNAFDADLDGYVDVVDVCPAVPDPEQLDTDRDGTGNACDQDDDNDGYSDIVDNCPLTPNPVQKNSDADGLGNSCDADDDNDGLDDDSEWLADTDPETPDLALHLVKGANFVALPFVGVSPATSTELLDELAPHAQSITRFGAEGTNVHAAADSSNFAFPLHPGGYVIHMHEAITVILRGAEAVGGPSMFPGANLVGFYPTPPALDGFGLLARLATQASVTSLARFNAATGRYETAVLAAGEAVGENFPIERGVAYLVGISATD